MLALIVLAAMFLLALPFAVFMRMQHGSGTQALHAVRARAGAQGAVSHAIAVLSRGVYALEDQAFASATPDAFFPFNDPAVDTPWEFHVTLRTRATASTLGAAGGGTLTVENALGFPNDGDDNTVDGYIRVNNEWLAYVRRDDMDPSSADFPHGTLTVLDEHRGLFGTTPEAHAPGAIVSFYPDSALWHLTVQDQQALININTAPYDVILNLLEELGIGTDAGNRMDIARAISNYRLYYTWWKTSTDIEYTPFQNLSMLKNIADADGTYWGATSAPLSAADFDKLRRYVTVHSEHTGTSRWQGPFALQGNIEAGPSGGDAATDQSSANLSSANGIGLGTIVRLTDTPTGDAEYRIVSSRNEDTQLAEDIDESPADIPVTSVAGFRLMDGATGYIRIEDPVEGHEWISYTGIDATAAPYPLLTGVTRGEFGTSGVDHDAGRSLDGCVISWEIDLYEEYQSGGADPDELHAEARHAININTVTSDIVLRSILDGISDDTTSIGPAEADAVAQALLDRTSGENWFVDRADLDAFFGTVASLSAAQVQLLRHNFDTDPADWPAVSTVPLRFNSGTMIGIDSVGIVDDRAGTPIAQVPVNAGLAIARIYDVAPPLDPLYWVLRSQKDFWTHWQTAGGNGNFLTNPINMGFDPATFDAATTDVYEDLDDGVGTVAPLLDQLNATRYTTLQEGLHESTPSFDLDFSIAADTEMVLGTEADVTNTTSEGLRSTRLAYRTHYDAVAGERHVEADSRDATIQPFAVEFWMRPADDVTSRQLLVDLGDGADPDALTAINQVRVYLEDGRLKLRIDEPVGDRTLAGYEGYVEAVSDIPLESNRWYHVAVAVAGTFRNEIAMFIDGIYDREMDWTFHHPTGQAGPGAVQEGSFLPVAMAYPNRTAAVTWGPGPTGEWPLTLGYIGLDDASWLPEQGAVVIGSAGHAYAYDAKGTYWVEDPPGSGNMVEVDALHLVDFADGSAKGLEETHMRGELVALMLPVVRTTVHSAGWQPPVATDEVSLWYHTDLGNGSYDRGAVPANSYIVGTSHPMGAWPTWAAYHDFRWIGLDPTLYPLEGAGDLLPEDRWKVLVKHTAAVLAGTPLLSGTLPCGPVGSELSLGGARDGGEVFEGELDELRLTALPNLRVAAADWSAAATDGTVERWTWDDATGWPLLGREAGSAFDMAEALGRAEMPLSGLFMVAGHIYSYQEFLSPPGHTFAGVAQMRDDLTPLGGGFAEVHEGWRAVIPLSFLPATRLVAGVGAGDTAIAVEDASVLPLTGYVKIGDEILAYEEIAAWGTPPQGELRLGGGYRRGCYNTAAAGHAAGDIVRHVPVRHLDRYQVGTAWGNHTGYTGAELGGDMCMYSFSVDRPGRLRTVRWRFKEPLEEGQQVAVVVKIDDTEPWNTNPDASAADNIWGRICNEGDQEDVLSLSNGAGERPVVNTRVEVRFYFDLSETEPYSTTYEAGAPVPGGGWSEMVELDEVRIEMVPEPMTF